MIVCAPNSLGLSGLILFACLSLLADGGESVAGHGVFCGLLAVGEGKSVVGHGFAPFALLGFAGQL